MTTLEDAIREAARAGRLDRTNIVHTAKGWQANVPSQNPGAWAVHIAADPVAALMGALVPGAPQPSKSVFD